jgi:hypothetical protein
MITSIAFPRKEMSKKKVEVFSRASWISTGNLKPLLQGKGATSKVE